MSYRVITKILALLIYLMSSFAQAEVDCPNYFRILSVNFGKKVIPIRQPSSKTVLNLTEAFGSENQVLLGVTKSGHFYLKVGDQAFNGAYFPIPSFKTASGISEGYLVRFPSIPQEKILEWLNRMSQKGSFQGFSLSCVHTACSALREGFDIRVAGTIGPNIFSGSTFRKILNNGFVDGDGRPVLIEIYQTSPRVPDPLKLQSTLDSQDVIFGAISLIYVGITVGGGLVVISTVIDFADDK